MSAIPPNREILPPRPDCLAAQRGFELLNPETRAAFGKGLTANARRLALNFQRRKEWTSGAIGASLCHAEIRAGPIRDPARWRRCHCGASVVMAPGAVATETDPKRPK